MIAQHWIKVGTATYVSYVAYTAMQSRNAVSAHLSSKQILPFGFAQQNSYTPRAEWVYTVLLMCRESQI